MVIALMAFEFVVHIACFKEKLGFVPPQLCSVEHDFKHQADIPEGQRVIVI